MNHRKVILSTMTFLLVVQGAALFLFYCWHMEPSPFGFQPSNRKVHVLLLSSWRSGSSFLGQVFSQHPSVFYLMEPAWQVWTCLKKPSATSLRMAVRDLLRSLFQCDLSTMEAYVKENSKPNLFMWGTSRALCSPPACPLTPHGNFSIYSHCVEACNAPSLQVVQDTCSTYSHVVLKVVRVFELEPLYPLLQDPSLNLHIIHLVRDPRAVLRSREEVESILRRDSAIVLEQQHVPQAEMQLQVVQRICHSHVRIIERAIQKPPPFLKARYKMVRYEDMVRNPLEEVNDMYEFVGLKMNPQLEEWIYKLTHGKAEDNNPFKVSFRNATDVSQAWRTKLSHDKVKKVQDVCEKAMSLLGYRVVHSEEEQKSLHTNLLVPKEH